MRAVSIRRAGPPESLECGDMPLREAGDGEVRIRVHRAGVNFADVLARQGIYPDAPKPPFVPGYEVSGVVESAGKGADGLRAGDRVAAFTRFGGYAEFALADARFAVPLTPDIDFPTAAAVPVNFATAYHCLFRTGPLSPGDRVLIHAAAGGVGLAAVQMAKGAGAELFGTAGSGEKIDFLRTIKLLESSRGFFGVNILRIFDHRPALGAVLLRAAFDIVGRGEAHPVIAAEIPLERAGEAHRLLHSRTSIGKIVLTVRD